MLLKIDLWLLGRVDRLLAYVGRYFKAPGRRRRPT